MITLTLDDLDTLHDTVYDATNISCSNKQLTNIYNQLPPHIQYSVLEYGMNDTPTRDDIHRFISKNLQLLETTQ